jgi:hypothetical protein
MVRLKRNGATLTPELILLHGSGFLTSLFTFDDVRFAHEAIDGETMIIDTVRGHLLVVSGGGSFILQLVRSGMLRDDLLRNIGDRYGREASENAEAFLAELTEVGVIKEVEYTPESHQVSSRRVPEDACAPNWPDGLGPTMIERYEDIAEIIAMDPIHDVEPSGWPRKIQ